ncbi:MAG: DUF357 domain-containing protein [Euryarchaeota archaeon]|nr:DUF357 domain-containing protein [Euryarchaeota archaeon]MBV1730570.1 DUF357 domain-containing protein [Methanobacterium sp.]MBU4547416.1 DUF357 domain-containing protein [Euryarchaeota archaeon]MBU4608675.1 DUF357 domain-containing protein [Euryarchaeota archaeon]MBV1755870.1 DUF357 domain-containing protein [Methanobacterium sp.]
MEYEERIKKDVGLLKKNLEEIKSLDFTAKEKEIIEMAENYQEDSLYYLEKKDFITSFGCITYAHGLIDSLRIIYNLI